MKPNKNVSIRKSHHIKLQGIIKQPFSSGKVVKSSIELELLLTSTRFITMVQCIWNTTNLCLGHTKNVEVSTLSGLRNWESSLAWQSN